MTESFPRQRARTRQFTLGAPRSCQISPDGDRVTFLRSRGGSDPMTCLWVMDVATGEERLVADPAALSAPGERLTDLERDIRERTREQAYGIVAYATDQALTLATFALAGQVYTAGLTGRDGPGRGAATVPGADSPPRPGAAPAPLVAARTPAFDPRPDPSGRRVAYVCEGALRVTELASGEDREIRGPAGARGLTFGLAEFIAAEEMQRTRGHWWAPDGTSLLVARVDDAPVQRWYIGDPANPERPPRQVAYPAAGTPNADVSLLLAHLGGGATEVGWDRAAFPYLVAVHWDRHGPLIVVQSRDQKTMRLLAADPATGRTTPVREDTDPHWVDIVTGVPDRTSEGRIVWTEQRDGTRRLLVAAATDLAGNGAEPVTPPGLHLRDVLSVDGETVLFTASGAEPTEVGLWTHGPDGLSQLGPERGVATGRRAGGTTLVAARTLADAGASVTVRAADGAEHRVTSFAEQPNLPPPRPEFLHAGQRAVRTALLLPSWHEPGSRRLPVLLDPYGGPHLQRVLAAQGAFLTSQWFAEQGFAVVVADGRGTPGRGGAWERAVAGDLAGPVLEDQVEALHAAAAHCGDLDTSRVAIRGWSFGGYLAALAVLRRPDVFHAAVAGAPVTDQRLYDTHYTERYLGDPATNADAYANCSPLRDAQRLAGRDDVTVRPLMIIHGLADDNVAVAHSLRLSAALLAAGYPHTVLPLSGVTHMTPQEEVAENLLLFQADFLRRALGM
jgi:dipeptidyl-peptidase-4